ncbi:MAG TPA: hypothetical protein ENK05_03050 [Gammaproteobacteria bacterium]|nr:hypothetical protein [Gammaproteobacteria bacterium]
MTTTVASADRLPLSVPAAAPEMLLIRATSAVAAFSRLQRPPVRSPLATSASFRGPRTPSRSPKPPPPVAPEMERLDSTHLVIATALIAVVAIARRRQPLKTTPRRLYRKHA